MSKISLLRFKNSSLYRVEKKALCYNGVFHLAFKLIIPICTFNLLSDYCTYYISVVIYHNEMMVFD